MKHAAVIGTGSWGTALAICAAARAERVSLWGRDAALVGEINGTRENGRYLAGVRLPENIEATTELADVAGAGVIFFVVPTRAMRSVAAAVQAVGVRGDAVLVSCSKGIEMGTGLRMTEILAQEVPGHETAVLSGPNHAEEIARGLAAAAVIGCGREETAKELQAFLTLPWFRTYTSDDVIGIEWGGAVKNVFAIAAGIAEGLGLGDNARAALVTRGLAEMTRLGTAAGGRFETFQGLSGVGDLIVTCYSSHSRNHRVGRQLGEGKSLPEIIAGMNMVAEGVPNTESIHEAARRYGVRTPIIDQMYSILYGGKPCGAALKELLARDPRPELS